MIEIKLITGRKKDIGDLLEAVAKFVKGSINNRVNVDLSVKFLQENDLIK